MTTFRRASSRHGHRRGGDLIQPPPLSAKRTRCPELPSHGHVDRSTLGGIQMNSIVYIVGLVVIIGAILAFLGFR
jgi:hypothetical protein